MIWAILAVAAAVFGIVFYFSYKEHKKLVAAGEILSRATNFMEKGEEFTLSLPDSASVTEGIRNLPYEKMSVSVKGNSKDQFFRFQGTKWTAMLRRQSEESGISVYRFEFTGWKTSRGMAEDSLNMNRLQTAIEKMFLRLDPETTVREFPLELKTRHSLL